MKIHLLDGTYELFRHYYGAPKRQNAQGREVGASLGLARSFLMLLQQPDVSHAAAAFDTEITSFRNEIFDGYKTGEGVEEELLQQFPLAEQAAAALGIVVWPMIEFEADDALATAAHRWGGDAGQKDGVVQVLLCSPDKDLAQCVTGERIVCLDRRREIVLDEEGVQQKFGVPPASIPDLLALMGDSADGIPGLKGWGAKSAATVLARYAHIEDIPAEAHEWDLKVRGAVRLADVLATERQDALLYRRLATLRTDVPLKESLDDLRWRGAHRDALEAFCDEVGDRRLLDRVPRWAGD